MADQPKPLEGELIQGRDLALIPDGEQLELIRDQVPDRDAGAAVKVLRTRGRGRPPGSMNRRNAKFRDQILALGPHPAVALQRAYSMPVEALAAELECSKLEAFQVGVRAAAELLPYIEGKQPVTVDIREKHDVVLVFAGNGSVGGEQIDAIASQVNEHGVDAIDWGSASIGGDIDDPDVSTG